MSTYQKSLIDEARPDEGNSLLLSETRKDKKPMELNQRLLKATAVLFVASCALSYAIRGSNETFSEAFLVSTKQSTEPNMIALSESTFSEGKGYVKYNHARCANVYAVLTFSKKKTVEACARACPKHPFAGTDICSNKYFSYDSRGGGCLHFDGAEDCEPNDDTGFDSFKFVDYGRCKLQPWDELPGSVDDVDTLQACQNLCTKNDECNAHEWFDDKCTLYNKSSDGISEPGGVAVAVCQNKVASYVSTNP